MTARALPLALAALSLTACPRKRERPAPPPPSIDAGSVDLRIPVADVPAVDVPHDTPRDVRRPPANALPTRPAMSGAWQRLPRVSIDESAVIARWDDPADIDGDEFPDPLVVLPLGAVRCTTIHDDRPCPEGLAPDGTDDIDGPRTLALVAFHSGDLPRAAPDGGAPPTDAATGPALGRLVGVRRVWVGRSLPMSRLASVSFSEFGPGVMVRTTLEVTATDRVTSTLDVVDLYVGVGLDRHAGALVHHCVRAQGERPARAGSISVTQPSMTPLVWRAALAHPYSGCDTSADALDAQMGAALAGGVELTVEPGANVAPSHAVALTVVNGELSVTERTREERRRSDAGEPPDPLRLPELEVDGMNRACSWDRVRARRDGHRCEFRVSRRDAPLPNCAAGESVLDPAPPSPIALLPREADAGATLVFTRGMGLLSARVPDDCRHSRRVDAERFSATLPVGLAASPDGRRVVSANGLDLWLHVEGHDYPVLLNPPAGPIPRGTLRAAAFVDREHLGLVISTAMLRVALPAGLAPLSPPSSLTVDTSEIRRGLRATP
ncbi:MAG: hypothetical protein R3A52_01255 [Polyangiales bacterium]